MRKSQSADGMAQPPVLRENARQTAAEVKELQPARGAPVTDALAQWLAGQYVVAAQGAIRQAGGEPVDLATLRAMCDDLLALRRSEPSNSIQLNPAKSNPIKPNQTQSNPIGLNRTTPRGKLRRKKEECQDHNQRQRREVLRPAQKMNVRPRARREGIRHPEIKHFGRWGGKRGRPRLS
jgi:hypothetical protein